MQGFVEIFREDKQGQRQVMHRGPNMILNNMYPQLLQLLGSGGNKYITKMQFGTGTTAPEATQQFLQLPVVPAKSVTAVVDAGTFSVAFSAYLESTEANGFSLSEAGLLTYDNVVVARTTFSAQVKSSDYQWGIVWTITLKSP